MKVTGLSADNRPVRFDARSLNTLSSNVAITGLMTTDAAINRASAPASVVAAACGSNFAGANSPAIIDIAIRP